MNRRRLMLLLPAAVLGVGLGAAGAWWLDRPAAAPRIGGPFRLIDQNGQGVTDQSFLGKILLVYFGYTHCPDACPTSLSNMAAAVRMLSPAQRKQVTILFITVDPARDTIAALKSYVGAFDAPIEALTGSPGAIAQAAREYRVYYARHDEKNGGYSMDHSSIIYVMNRKGDFVTNFNEDTPPAQMAEALRKLIG